jgi:hypothetical protein
LEVAVPLSRSQRRIHEVLEDLYEHEPPRHKLTKREAEALIGGFEIRTGNGQIYESYGLRQSLCFLQTANVMNAVLNGEKVQGGGDPEFTGIDEIDPLLEEFGYNFNDAIESHDTRKRLLAFVPRLFNTSAGPATEARQRLMRDEVAKIVVAELERGVSQPLGYEVEDFLDYDNMTNERRRAVFSRTSYDEGGEVVVANLNLSERRQIARSMADSVELGEVLGGYYGRHPEEGFKFLDKLLRVRGSRKAAQS